MCKSGWLADCVCASLMELYPSTHFWTNMNLTRTWLCVWEWLIAHWVNEPTFGTPIVWNSSVAEKWGLWGTYALSQALYTHAFVHTCAWRENFCLLLQHEAPERASWRYTCNLKSRQETVERRIFILLKALWFEQLTSFPQKYCKDYPALG